MYLSRPAHSMHGHPEDPPLKAALVCSDSKNKMVVGRMIFMIFLVYCLVFWKVKKKRGDAAALVRIADIDMIQVIRLNGDFNLRKIRILPVRAQSLTPIIVS